MIAPYTFEERLKRLGDLFGISYADHDIASKEHKLIFKYAIGLSFSRERANDEIEKRYLRLCW